MPIYKLLFWQSLERSSSLHGRIQCHFCILPYMCYPPDSTTTPHWCLGPFTLVYVSYEHSCHRISVGYYVELNKDRIDMIIINIAILLNI